MVSQVHVCKIIWRETTASRRQMLKYPASRGVRSQGPSLPELPHKVTCGIRLHDQFQTGAVSQFPCWNVVHTCILAGVRCVGPRSAIRDIDSHWYFDIFDPRNYAPRYAVACAPFRHVCCSYVLVRPSNDVSSNRPLRWDLQFTRHLFILSFFAMLLRRFACISAHTISWIDYSAHVFVLSPTCPFHGSREHRHNFFMSGSYFHAIALPSFRYYTCVLI